MSLTQTKNGLGIEIAGLSQKGLFVSDVMSADGKQHLQIGDQVLKINGTSCGRCFNSYSHKPLLLNVSCTCSCNGEL